jgi:thymidine kinase
MKLLFRYGTMSSSKSANLLMLAYNYEKQGKKILVIKPSLENRDSDIKIVSRTGLCRKVDFLIKQDTNIETLVSLDIDFILVDECQFLEPNHIDQLRNLTKQCYVICYGLRTCFDTSLFPASKRLMEIADTIEEIKTSCVFCNKKAIINLKYNKDGITIKNNSSIIDLGGDDKYKSVCWCCWNSGFSLLKL